MSLIIETSQSEQKERELLLEALLEAWELIQPDYSEDVSEKFKNALKVAKDYNDQR